MSVPFDVTTITSITRSGSTATATVASTATLYTGQTVLIYGAVQTAYNGVFNITVANGTTFTFTVVGTPTTPATTLTALGFRGGGNPFQPLLNGPQEAWVIDYHSAALENSALLKNGPGTLSSFYGANAATAGCWIMLFDSLTLPPDGTAPLILDASAAEDNFYVDVPEGGIRFANGIYAAASSTAATLTVKSDSMTHFDALFHD